MADKSKSLSPSPEAVLSFLEENPDFLIKSSLGSAQEGRIINLGQALINRASKAIRQSDQLEDIHANNQRGMLLVHKAAYLLMAAATQGEMLAVIKDHFPSTLDIAAARLAVDKDSPLADTEGAIGVDSKALKTLTAGKEISLGTPSQAQHKFFTLFADKSPPPSVAMARLPAIPPENSSFGVLALAGKNQESFDEKQGTDFIVFITTLIAVGLIARAGGD